MNCLIFLLFLCTLKRVNHAAFTQSTNDSQIDPKKTIVWGPGLNPEEIVMRARYFFVQLCDFNGKNLTRSPGDDVVKAQIQGTTKESYSCHFWVQVLDCQDGSFIIRYKLHNTCFNMKLNVQVKGENLQKFPLNIPGPVYEEECYCPKPSIDTWLRNFGCNKNYSQINNDLEPFSNVDFAEIRQNIIKKYHRPNSISICHYVVKDNKIYRKCYGQHVGFKVFMDAILLSLTRKVVLPDIELFVNLGDWPLVKKDNTIYPVFSWCGSTDTKDIIMPTYDLTESSLEAMGRVMLDMLSVQGNTKVPWEKKIEKLFWRGRDSCIERLNLIDISRKNPDLFNASITNFFFFEHEIDRYGPKERHVSFFDFFKFKYQLNIDGTVAAYRFPYLLAGDSLVFKQESMYYEYFYNDLVPNVHYVPVKKDLSDLVDKIQWAKEHDADLLKIVRSARQYIRDNLLPQDIFCYHATLFNEWSKRLKNKIEVLNDMEEVEQPKHSCKCHIDNARSKDEL